MLALQQCYLENKLQSIFQYSVQFDIFKNNLTMFYIDRLATI